MPFTEELAKKIKQDEKERFEPIFVLPCGVDPNQKGHNPNGQTEVPPKSNHPDPKLHSEELVLPSSEII